MRKIVIIISCLCILFMNFHANAMDVPANEKVNQLISAQVTESEISEISALLFEAEGDIIEESNVTNNGSVLYSHNINNIYKVYNLPALMITKYNSNPTLDALLTDECAWEVYTKSILSENSIARISEINGKKQIAGISDRTDSYLTNEKIALAIEQGDLSVSEIKEIKIAKSGSYHSYFVFIITAETNYVIAFPSQENYLGVETGKLYTLDELMKTMDGIFDEAALEENPDSNGGVPLRDPSINDNTGIIFVAVALSLIALVVIIVLMKEKFTKASKVQ